MADTAAPDGETPAQLQARLRREKRKLKMADQGEERLAKIKALNGGVAPADELLGGPAKPVAQKGTPKAATVHDDPEEADIDTVSGVNTPSNQQSARTGGGGGMQENPFAAMLGMQGGQQQGGEGQDPMMAMMSQLTSMMGGNPQDPNDPNQPPQLPPMLQAMMGGGMGAEAAAAPTTGSAYLWRIAHALFAASLAFYVSLTSTFTGSKMARTVSSYQDASSYGLGSRLFIIFTSAELVLQSSRFFLEKGQLKGSGWLAMIANSGFVPEPYAQYVRTLGRYIGIVQTVVSDGLVVVFVLGIMAWWNGAVGV